MDQAVRGTAVFDLIRRGNLALAEKLAQLEAVIDQPSLRAALNALEFAAAASRSSVVVAAFFAAKAATEAHSMMFAQEAIRAADVAAERSYRLTCKQGNVNTGSADAS